MKSNILAGSEFSGQDEVFVERGHTAGENLLLSAGNVLPELLKKAIVHVLLDQCISDALIQSLTKAAEVRHNINGCVDLPCLSIHSMTELCVAVALNC